MKKQIAGAAPPPNPFNLRTNNVSGEEIPASAIMLVNDASDADDDGSYDVTKPDGTDGAYWINSPSSVPIELPGAATNRFPCMVAYDDASDPEPGDEWGPVADSWLLSEAGSGFRILGGPADGLVRVEKIGGSGTQSKLVQIVDIDEGPNDGDDFSPPYQSVWAKDLTLQGYVAATSDTVTTDNSDIEITTTKGGKKHGSRGNGITVTIAIDGGITPDAEAAFDDSTDALSIKVKNDTVLWSDVIAAVAIPLNSAFTLTAVTPSAAVGSGSITIPALSGGVDGTLAVSGARFAIGGVETAAEVHIGQKLEVVSFDGAWQLLEWKAEEKYVEVVEVLDDPEDDDEDSPFFFQTVIVSELKWFVYQPATTGTVESDNTTFVISTHKGYRKHGSRGNDITVTFEVDSGISGDAEAAFTEAVDPDPAVLAIKVKTISVLWSAVEDAVAEPFADFLFFHAFSLIADDPTAEVGASIGSVTATLAGGVDGGWGTVGVQFAVGDHDLGKAVAIADRFRVVWDGSSQRWEILGAGQKSRDTTNGGFAIVIDEAGANKGSQGACIPLNSDLEPTVIIDPLDPDYDDGAVEDAKILFYSAHQYSKCPVGARIELFKMSESGGEEVSRFVTFGLLTDCLVELAQRSGFAPETALVGGATAADIKWDATDC